MTTERHEEGYKAGFDPREKYMETLGIPPNGDGQYYPQRNPQPPVAPDPLGEPLTIREVAHLLGCSPWTVRHSYLPRGLPYLRFGALGKLIFYRAQVVRWILEHQRKGGK